MNDSKLNMQQSRPYHFREGFPISSADVNDLLDSYLYDLFTILKQDVAKSTNLQIQLINAINNIDGRLDNNKDESVMNVKDDHTPNWRHI